MSEDRKKGQQVKSQEDKNNYIYRSFASVLLKNGDYHWKHEMLRKWGEEDMLSWEEEFLPASMRRGQEEKKVYLKMDFWKEMQKIKAKNLKQYETTVCRYCKHAHWHANEDGGGGCCMEFFCQLFSKIEIPVHYCSDRKIVE